MVRKLLLLLAISMVASMGKAQVCIPDYTVPDYGIYPDSATGFDTAWVGQSYAMTVTNYVPPDTCVVIIVPPCSVLTMDSIVVTGFSGLPPNFTYGCNPVGCSFLGGTYGCVQIWSTSNPTSPDVGRYNLVIDVEAYVGGFGIPNPFTIDYYYIDVLEATGLEESVQSVSKIDTRPNPFTEQTNISFNLEVGADVRFTVVNLLGEQVHAQSFKGSGGYNTIRFDGSDLPEGIYIYTISSGKSVQTRKMIIGR